MRLFEHTQYDFLGNRRKAYLISLVLLVLGLGALAVRGLAFGIDFLGGTEMQLRFAQPSATLVDDVRNAVALPGAEIKTFGSDTDILVRVPGKTQKADSVADAVAGRIRANMATNPVEIRNFYAVSPKISDDLRTSSIYAVLGGLIVILIYVAIRFKPIYAVAGVVALFHDVLVTLGLFALLHGAFDTLPLEVDQSIIAAFLTIVGYSINDTVVVFDRIREYLGVYKDEPLETVFNRSINTTLSRTVITSGTTLMAIMVLFLFIGPAVRGFAFAMLIGVSLGTYSSIFVAAPIVLDWLKRHPDADAAGRPVLNADGTTTAPTRVVVAAPARKPAVATARV